ncbi:MAG: calcium-translocating P-type ATPase, PMCA-type [Ruminococcaceae bacterium]|nr:calcium-translocating P-type ATPase, PMCA-type [Oscillospiraceae bacterium]
MGDKVLLGISGRRKGKVRGKEGVWYSGVSSSEVAGLRERFGANVLSRQKKVGVVRQFFRNCNDPIIRILIGALVLNIVFMFPDVNWIETAGIGFAVFVSAFVSTISEYSGNRAFERLYEKLSDTEYTVLRDNLTIRVPIGDIVVMDLVYLSAGEVVPVDGVLVSGEVRVDESSLTGESTTVGKMACGVDFSAICPDNLPAASVGDKNVVFRGSAICSGECTVLAVRVGDGTMYGALAAELQGDTLPSPLKQRLSALARTISKIGYASAVFVALSHLLRVFWLDAGMQWDVTLLRMRDIGFVWRECLSAFTMAISVIVVAVPEGLPMMITVVLSSNMQKMMKSGVLVRKLVGIETSGNLSMLFTDKTGTITTGELSVADVYTPDIRFDSVEKLACHTALRDAVFSCAAACGSFVSPNTTEKAINRFLRLDVGSDYTLPVGRLPFDSGRKFSAGRVVDNGRDILYICGAPEYILPCCDRWMDTDGLCHSMDGLTREKIKRDMDMAAANEYRIVLQAFGDGGHFSEVERIGPDGISLVFTALFFLQDEIRPEVSDAVKDCRDAGIQVVMLTGDNARTAASVAGKCGILSGKSAVYIPGMVYDRETELVLNGSDLVGLSDEQLTEILPDIRVIARVSPTDKSRLVRVSQAAGHIVGMTGDGINDAPALKAADVGFAMGSGTEVSKSAGDIVITDNNFSSIRKAVLFGRTIFQSIRKFIVFQLIMNLSAVGVSLVGPFVGVENPVTVIQMLWINIIMDTLGSLAFAGEAPLAEYMKMKPLNRTEPILTGGLIRQILISAAYTIALCVVFLCSSASKIYFGRGNDLYFLTAFFALFVFCGICNAFTVRTPRVNLFAHLGKNKAFLLIMPGVAFVQLLIVYFGGSVFRTVPISADALLFCLFCALTVLPVDAVRKILFREK